MLACQCECCNAPQRNFHKGGRHGPLAAVVTVVTRGLARGAGRRQFHQRW